MTKEDISFHSVITRGVADLHNTRVALVRRHLHFIRIAVIDRFEVAGNEMNAAGGGWSGASPVGVGLAGLNKNKVAVDAARIDALPIGERLRVSFNELAFETSLLSKLLSLPPPSSPFPSPSRPCFSTCSRLSLFSSLLENGRELIRNWEMFETPILRHLPPVLCSIGVILENFSR